MTGISQQVSEFESIRRKKFRASELPISVSQRAALDNLLYLFKKKGGFDAARKQIWAAFNESDAKAMFTDSLNDIAESEIERDPFLLSRERGKAATLIEGAVDRSDIYKGVEASLDTISSTHLDTILASLRTIRRQQVGDENASAEEDRGSMPDEAYRALVRVKRDQRELARQQELEAQRIKEAESAKARADELMRQRELRKRQDEEARRKQRERHEQRKDEHRGRDHEGWYESKRRDGSERHRDAVSDRDEWDSRDYERGRAWSRYRDRERSRCRSRESGDKSSRSKHRSSTPKETPPAPLDEKSLEDVALELLLKEGKELAEKSRQKPEFDFEQAEAMEDEDQAIPAQKQRLSGIDGKQCRTDQTNRRGTSPRHRRGQSVASDHEKGKPDFERDSVDRYRERGYGDRRKVSETRDSPRRRDCSLRRDVFDRDFELYRPDSRDERVTDDRIASRSPSRSTARGREREIENRRGSERDRARDHDRDRGRGRENDRSNERDMGVDRSVYADRGRDLRRERDERDSDRGGYRCRDWDKNRGGDRGHEWARDGDRSYRPRNHSRSLSRDAPRRRKSPSGRSSRSHSLTRRSVRKEDRSMSRSRRRSRSRSLLDIDRYVPATSNRSRSPKRRDRDRDRDREERGKYLDIDRYIPGGDESISRDRHKHRDRRCSWRRSRSR